MASAAVVVVVVGVAAAFAFAAAADPATGAAGLTLRRRDLAGFHELLESAEVFLDLLPRLAAEELGDGKPDASGGGDVVDHDAHFRALPAGPGEEADGAGVVHAGAFERSPGDQLVLLFVDNLRIPFDRCPARCFHLPVR